MFKHLPPPPPVGCGLNIGCVPCITTIASGGGGRASATLLALLTNRCKPKTVRCVSLSYSNLHLIRGGECLAKCSWWICCWKWSFMLKYVLYFFNQNDTKNSNAFRYIINIRECGKCRSFRIKIQTAQSRVSHFNNPLSRTFVTFLPSISSQHK